MVLPLLLSDQNTPVRYRDLGRTVLQCLHVVHSMERALSIFHSALTYGDFEGSLPPPGSPLHLLSSFDAHVGDCACQARAQMLWELVALYSTPDNKCILESTITLLEQLRVNAALLLREVEQSYGKSRNPKLNDLVTHLAIRDRIYFTSFLTFAASRSSVPASGAPFRGTCHRPSVIWITANPYPLTEPQTERLTRSTRRHRDITVNTDWNPRDLLALTRFLTMCYLLSERKVATVEAGPPTRLRVRVDLLSVYEKNAQELEALQMMGQAPSYRFKAEDGVAGMNRQCEAMQVYLSRVAADWAKQTATRTGDKTRALWSRYGSSFTIAAIHSSLS